MNRFLLSFAALSLALSGCDRLPNFSASAPRHRLVVIPSVQPRQVFEITVTDERSLCDIARRLGSTVEILVRDNRLVDRTLHSGDRLRVRATPKRLAEFKRLQVVRAERRQKRAEAKRLRELAAKVAKPAPKKRRLRRRRRRKRRRRSRASRRPHHRRMHTGPRHHRKHR